MGYDPSFVHPFDGHSGRMGGHFLCWPSPTGSLAVIAGQSVEEEEEGAGTVTYDSIGTVAHVEADTSITVTPPEGSNGDYLILGCVDDKDQALTDLDGFTLLDSVTSSSSRLSVAYIVDAGAANYDIIATTDTELTCVIVRLTKNQGTFNIADYATTAVSGVASTATIPDNTVDQDGCIALTFMGNDDLVSQTEPTGPGTSLVYYDTADPMLQVFQKSVNTGTITGDEIDNDYGDISIIQLVVEAE
jgi:hypothetical protein